MRIARKNKLIAALAIFASAWVGAVGCLSFGDLSGGASSDAGSDASDAASASDVATIFDAGEMADGAPVTFASCNAAHLAVPAAPDGFFLIAGADGGAAFRAYCDMTADDGGWMLVTPDMIAVETLTLVTSVHSADLNGGLIVQNYANGEACGGDSGAPSDYSVITFTNYPAWTQIRSRQAFNGTVDCWALFGSSSIVPSPNLQSFDPSVDVMYDEIKMGGLFSDGGTNDTFSGPIAYCTGATNDFWAVNTASQRSSIVIQRRDIPGPAGLGTKAYCLEGNAPGTTATTSWEYRDIYVR